MNKYFFLFVLFVCSFAFANDDPIFPNLVLVKDAKPINRINVKFPEGVNAAGFVRVAFVVSKEGIVVNKKVIQSVPDGVYEASVLDALNKATYPLYLVDGQPTAFQTVVVFQFANAMGEFLPHFGALTGNGKANASDPYLLYLSNVYLLNSKQILESKDIQYIDQVNGSLLKSVLDPKIGTTMLSIYFAYKRAGLIVPDLPQLFLQPIINRYEKAFESNPRGYQAEYLDCLELRAFIMNYSVTPLRAEATNTNTRKTDINPSNQELTNSVQKLTKSVSDRMIQIKKSTADSIRDQVNRKMFDQEGAKRALLIADSLSSLEKAVAFDNLNVEQKLTYGGKIYFQHCVFCHSRDGQGIKGAFPGIVDSPTLSSSSLTINAILIGKNVMPSFINVMPPADIAAISTYIQKTFGHQEIVAITEKEVVDRINEIKLAK